MPMNCGVRRARASLAILSGTPPYSASATEPAMAACVSASPPRATARHTAPSKDMEGQRADERLGYRPLARLVERAGWLDVLVGTVQVVPKPVLQGVPDVCLTGPLAGKENGSRH